MDSYSILTKPFRRPIRTTRKDWKQWIWCELVIISEPDEVHIILMYM